MTAASVVTDKAARSLNDPDKEQWSVQELVEYLSDAQRAAVLLRPEVNPVTAKMQCVTGSKQTIPDDGFVLIEVTRNLGADGETPGRVITPTSRSGLDRVEPGWHTTPANDDGTSENFIHDIRNRKTFYLYPQQPETANFVEIVYAQIPGELETPDDDLEIDDIYIPALLGYVLARACEKDTSVHGELAAKSQMYYQLFFRLITGEAEKNDADLTIRHESSEADRGVGA